MKQELPVVVNIIDDDFNGWIKNNKKIYYELLLVGLEEYLKGDLVVDGELYILKIISNKYELSPSIVSIYVNEENFMDTDMIYEWAIENEEYEMCSRILKLKEEYENKRSADV